RCPPVPRWSPFQSSFSSLHSMKLMVRKRAIASYWKHLLLLVSSHRRKARPLNFRHKKVLDRGRYSMDQDRERGAHSVYYQ
ncbi:hypothetical protein PFISCL1PPCAC_16532, partial [Pristionchus fissidentatus]